MDSDVSIKFTAMHHYTSVWDNTIDQVFHNQNIIDSLYDSIEGNEDLFLKIKLEAMATSTLINNR